MAEASAPEKKAIMQQASAIFGSVISQENTIAFLRTLDLPVHDEANIGAIASLIDSLQSGRQELVNHFEFLGVAFDHGWDAARLYRDDPPEDASKRVLSAVSKAKKKKEADDRDKKKKRRSASSSASKRRRDSDNSDKSCSHSGSHHHCCPQPQWQQPYQKQFRAGQNLPCIRCGDTAHHWRQCPKPATK